MSEARKCDRCKDFYDIAEEQQDKLKPYDLKGAYAKLLVCDNNREYPETVRWYDLCPKCVELLDKWLENPDSWTPDDCLVNLGDTNCTDRSNGATEKELELASKLNDAKIYIAQLKNELGYTMTKEEIELISVEAKYKDPCESCHDGICEQCYYGYTDAEDKKKRWLENHKEETKLSDPYEDGGL